ncbi:signal peptidase I [Candidatus Nitrososphaera sp. FF02]|uniref:signal peptidase I n=1 Tax=Candidatus Nitrososphaera sp. FF02 TaxID=3398226 RepID=UPI0039EA6C61
MLAHKHYLMAVALVVASLALAWLAMRAALNVENPVYAVYSESMVPALELGDVAIIRNGPGYSFHDLKAGDIIIFHTDDAGGRVIIHRVVEIYADVQTGERLVKAKGDNNLQSYEGLDYPIRENDYYGKVVGVIPKIAILSANLNPAIFG